MSKFKKKRKGQHLTWNDRLVIERMLLAGADKRSIAQAIGCCLATVYNEIKRATYIHTNSDLTEEERYCPDQVQEKYQKQKVLKGPAPVIPKDPELVDFISRKICEEKYSPQAILLHIKNNDLKFQVSVSSVNTIYKSISKGHIPGVKLEMLPDQGRHRTKKQKEKDKKKKTQKRAVKGVSIERRPDIVEDRVTFGFWEMDCVVGKTKNKKALLVLTERKTRKEIIVILKRHTTDEVRKALNRIEKKYGSKFYKIFKSITVDNGSEFADYESMEKALYRVGKRTEIFYCHPHAPQERGSNENANKLIRRFFPKGTNFDEALNKHDVEQVEKWINDYPRACLGGRTAEQCFQAELQLMGFT